MTAAAVRAIAGVATIVGLSAHTREQVDQAVLEPISYVAIGPVFGTATKATGYDRVGVEMVREASRRAGVLEAGAASVAVIGDLLASGDPERRTRDFLDRIGG